MTTSEVDGYLAVLPVEARAALEKIRQTIQAAAPDAVEMMSYGMPTFKYRERPLAYFAAFANHCSLFPASSAVMETYKDELRHFETSKGTLRFPINKPLSSALVRKIVRARMAEIETSLAGKQAKKQQSDLPKLAAPAQRALARAGIRNLGQLTQFTEAQIKELHGIGPNALKELQRALKSEGLSFAAAGRKK